MPNGSEEGIASPIICDIPITGPGGPIGSGTFRITVNGTGASPYSPVIVTFDNDPGDPGNPLSSAITNANSVGKYVAVITTDKVPAPGNPYQLKATFPMGGGPQVRNGLWPTAAPGLCTT